MSDDSNDEFEVNFPSFDATLGVTYEDALRVVRGYLRSYEPAGLPGLLENCRDLNLGVGADELNRVYYGPLAQQEPELIRNLLSVFGYQAMQLGFDVGPVRGKKRYMFFLATAGRLKQFQLDLASFTADSK